MNSLNKRKQLVGQLRKAHFPFGFQDNKGIESEYIEKYKQFDFDGNAQGKDARATNFNIGDKNIPIDYLSEFKERYLQYPLNAEKAPSINNSDGKYVVFGYEDPNYDTNYKEDYTKKNGNNERARPNLDQKKPNIDFGDSLTDFTTTYKDIHDHKKGQKFKLQNPEFRKSNLILGDEKNKFQTQNNAVYIEKPINNYHVKQMSNVSNINLGDGGQTYKSQNKQNFGHKQIPFEAVPKEKIQDFKNAHFHFGFPTSSDYTSQAQQKYNKKPIQLRKGQKNRQSHINLTTDDNNYFDSTYNKEFQGKEGQKLQNCCKNGRQDNILIGADVDPNKFISEAHSQFKGINGNSEKVISLKPQNSLNLNEGNGDYLTHNQNIYKNRFQDHENNRLSNADINRLKGLNFTTGFQNRDYGLTSEAYGKTRGQSNKLSAEKLAGMKNTNIVTGNQNPFKGNTTYKTSFPWKKNDE